MTIRAEAFDDERIAFLAKLLGCSADEAFMRMVRLWSVCAAQQTDEPEVHRIRACLLDLNGEVLLVQSGLGDDSRRDPAPHDGGIRVRGCDKTDWYYALIEQQGQVEAGKARAAVAQRDRAGKFLPDQRSLQPEPSPSDLCLDLDLISDLARPELPDPDLGAIVGVERERAIAALTPKAIPPKRTREDLRRKLFTDAWTYAGLKHEELKRAGVDPHARNCWSGLPNASSQEAQDLFARIDELAIGDDVHAAFARAGEVIRNRVDVAAAVANRDPKTLRWFTPARMWNAKSFAIDKDLSPQQAALPTQPSRASPAKRPDEPVRKIPTFR